MGKDNPLYLPPGSVRALVFLMVMTTVCVMAMRGLQIPEIVQDVTIAVIAFYFGQKSGKGERKEILKQ